MKKIYTFLSLCLITITNFAQTTFTNTDNVKYEILDADSKTAQVIQYDTKPTGAITILDKVTINGEEYSVTTIKAYNYGNGAFYECPSLTSVTIPNSVTSIGDWAFFNCTSLTTVTIPNFVTSIGDNVFRMCTSLTSVTIPDSVTSIGELAFSSSGLTSVSIGDSVTSIGSYAFAKCSGLTSVTIPNSVTSIGDNVFSECSGLTSVTIPNSVTSIGSYAFVECSSLESIVMPEFVTSIGFGAFRWCTSLTSVTIPASVTSIGESAFGDCSSLSSVTSLAETPADISSYNNVFNNIVASPELIIPSGYKTNYDTNGWSSYFNTVTEDNSLSNKKYTINGVKLFTNNGEVKANLINISLKVYTVTGKKVVNSNLKKGLYIVVAKNQEGKIHTQKVVL